MNNNYIEGGAFQIARKIFDSEIWLKKPATWTKIWIYILGKVNHANKHGFERGENFFNFADERKRIGNDITPDICKKFLKFLKTRTMISTSKSTRGIVIKVLNYNTYQDLSNYGLSSEAPRKHMFFLESSKIGTTPSTTSGTTENEKSVLNNITFRNVNEEQGTTGSTRHGTLGAPQRHHRSTTINKNDKNTHKNTHTSVLFNFDLLWEQYPKKDGRKAAEKSFRTTVLTGQDYENIQKALSNYLQTKNVITGNIQYIKNGSTWFNNWQDWIDNKEPEAQAEQKEICLNPYVKPPKENL